MSNNATISVSMLLAAIVIIFIALTGRSCQVTQHADTTERIKAVCSGDLLHDAAKSSACILILKNAEGGN